MENINLSPVIKTRLNFMEVRLWGSGLQDDQRLAPVRPSFWTELTYLYGTNSFLRSLSFIIKSIKNGIGRKKKDKEATSALQEGEQKFKME